MSISENPDSEIVDNPEVQSPPKKKTKTEPEAEKSTLTPVPKKSSKSIKNEDMNEKIVEDINPELPFSEQELIWFEKEPDIKDCEVVVHTYNSVNIQIEQSIRPLLSAFMKNQFSDTNIPNEIFPPENPNMNEKLKKPNPIRKIYKCDYPNNCKKEFAILTNLEIHVAKAHDTVLEYCSFCPHNKKHGFTQHKSLIKHIEENHEYQDIFGVPSLRTKPHQTAPNRTQTHLTAPTIQLHYSASRNILLQDDEGVPSFRTQPHQTAPNRTQTNPTAPTIQLHHSASRSMLSQNDEEYSDFWPCMHCKMNFESSKLLKDHTESKHLSKNFQISKNNIQYSEEKPTKEVNKKDIVEALTIYLCKLCSENFCSIQELSEHLKTCTPKHLPTKPEKLKTSTPEHLQGAAPHPTEVVEGGAIWVPHPVPTKPYEMVKIEQNENDITENETYKCKFCSENFSSNEKLSEHNMFQHHSCEFCKEIFETFEALKIHVENLHKEQEYIPQYMCDICEKVFHFVKERNDHIKNAHKTIYKCDYSNDCNKKFSKILQLEKHVEKVHNSVLKYCTLCPMRTQQGFTKYESLQKHIKKVHENCSIEKLAEHLQGAAPHPPVVVEGSAIWVPHPVPTKPNEIMNIEQNKNDITENEDLKIQVEYIYKEAKDSPQYKCEICGKKLHSVMERNVHIKNAHKTIYKCDYPNDCNKECSTILQLEKHVEKVHNSVLKYCTLCPISTQQGFTQHESLQKHHKNEHDNVKVIFRHESTKSPIKSPKSSKASKSPEVQKSSTTEKSPVAPKSPKASKSCEVQKSSGTKIDKEFEVDMDISKSPEVPKSSKFPKSPEVLKSSEERKSYIESLLEAHKSINTPKSPEVPKRSSRKQKDDSNISDDIEIVKKNNKPTPKSRRSPRKPK